MKNNSDFAFYNLARSASRVVSSKQPNIKIAEQQKFQLADEEPTQRSVFGMRSIWQLVEGEP